MNNKREPTPQTNPYSTNQQHQYPQQNFTTTNGDPRGQFLITELGTSPYEQPNPYQVAHRGPIQERPQTDESDRGIQDN